MKETTYIKTGPFAKHSIEKCKDYYTNNHVRACLRETMEQTIIWQGDIICCKKSLATLQCKICMVERKEILHRVKANKHQVINDNSDIYSSYRYGSRLHKFNRTITPTSRTRSAQKKTLQLGNRDKNIGEPVTLLCQPPLQTNTVNHQTPIRFDRNISGLPYRSPSYHPTKLELAQFAQYQAHLDNSAI